MQLFWMLAAFVAKVFGFAIVLTAVSIRIFQISSNGAMLLVAVASFLVSLGILAVDEVYLYPHFRNPMRNLCTVESGYNGRIIAESPRGRTPLQWMIANPDADLIHSRGKLGQSLLYPVAPEALRDILSTNADDFQKPWGISSYLVRAIGWGLITLEGAPHKQQRKALTSAFNIKHIRALYPTMWQKAGLLADRMHGEMRKRGQIEICTWASRYALDVIGVGALSREFNALKSTLFHPIASSFAKLLEPELYMIKYMALTMACPSWIAYRTPMRGNKVVAHETRFLRKACEEILEEEQNSLRKRDAKMDNKILSKIISNEDMGKDQIVDHMLTTIGAGHETSASSISWSTHLLTMPENIHYQKILRDEIRSALPTTMSADGTIRLDFTASEAELQQALETLPYLNGICEEVLRLYPTVPATLREPIRDTTVAGTVVPKGTLVVIMPWAINRNPRFWGPDADQMRPERWIDRLPDGSLRVNKHGGAISNYCNITFLHGSRACIGRDFAKAELKCMLASVFGQYDIRRPEGDTRPVRVSGLITTKPKGGLNLSLFPA